MSLLEPWAFQLQTSIIVWNNDLVLKGISEYFIDVSSYNGLNLLVKQNISTSNFQFANIETR